MKICTQNFIQIGTVVLEKFDNKPTHENFIYQMSDRILRYVNELVYRIFITELYLHTDSECPILRREGLVLHRFGPVKRPIIQ